MTIENATIVNLIYDNHAHHSYTQSSATVDFKFHHFILLEHEHDHEPNDVRKVVRLKPTTNL